MIFEYSIIGGKIRDDKGGVVAARCWAGNGEGKNNPERVWEHNVGPLPPGLYKVGPWEDEHPHLGNNVAKLEQVEGETYGRGGFYVHGPSLGDNYGQESKGCIVVIHEARLVLREMAPDFIRVS